MSTGLVFLSSWNESTPRLPAGFLDAAFSNASIILASLETEGIILKTYLLISQ